MDAETTKAQPVSAGLGLRDHREGPGVITSEGIGRSGARRTSMRMWNAYAQPYAFADCGGVR